MTNAHDHCLSSEQDLVAYRSSTAVRRRLLPTQVPYCLCVRADRLYGRFAYVGCTG